MSAYLFDLREYLEQNFDDPVPYEENRYLIFPQQQQKLYQTFHADAKRSIWRFRYLFAQNANEQEQLHLCKCLQCIFERFILEVWGSLPIELQVNYYQGCTDILEIIFGAYVNFNEVCRQSDKIEFDKDGSYQLFLGEIDQFFNFQFLQAHRIAVNAIEHLFQINRFNTKVFMCFAIDIHNQLKKEAKQFCQILDQNNIDIVNAAFLAYIMSFCLHFTQDIQTSCILTKQQLSLNREQQISFIAKLVAQCATSTVKGTKNPKFLVRLEDKIELKQPLDALEIINGCVQKVFSVDENIGSIIKFINEK